MICHHVSGSFEFLLNKMDEFFSLFRMRRAARRARKMVPSQHDPHLAFCYSILPHVSRSFAMVIQKLPLNLRDAVCLFYVILRALDTVEDDMNIPIETKVPILKAFHEHIYDPTWKFVCGEKHCKSLMEGFEHVAKAFLHLSDGYQDVIADVTKKMGAGMAKFIVAEVETVTDYDEYCHYVAGLVGCGLSRLFAESGLEDLASDSLSNSMGLFLQKVNVTRDYLEDITELPAPRMFWPREIWGKYGASLEDFKKEENEAAAVACLNNMITDALRHATDSLQYMSALKDSSIFQFCAIPQIMAMATLALCYNNAQVFKGVLKIRPGVTAKIVVGTKSMADVYAFFHHFISMLNTKIDMQDPSATQTLKHFDDIIKTCTSSMNNRSRLSIIKKKAVPGLLLVGSLILLFLMVVLAASALGSIFN